MERPAASLVRDQLVYEAYEQPKNQRAPPSLGKSPFQKEVGTNGCATTSEISGKQSEISLRFFFSLPPSLPKKTPSKCMKFQMNRPKVPFTELLFLREGGGYGTTNEISGMNISEFFEVTKFSRRGRLCNIDSHLGCLFRRSIERATNRVMDFAIVNFISAAAALRRLTSCTRSGVERGDTREG